MDLARHIQGLALVVVGTGVGSPVVVESLLTDTLAEPPVESLWAAGCATGAQMHSDWRASSTVPPLRMTSKLPRIAAVMR